MSWIKTLGLVGAVAAAGVAWTALADDGPEYSVERVVDGDTIVVQNADGERGIRVRLLNVDTPEMGKTGTLEGCYAQEASDFLTELLPPGTPVELETDVDTTDRYGRLLAGVYRAGEDSLINAEIARGGYGVSALYGPNEKFYAPVHRAEREAAAAGLGVHDPELGCSPAARQDSAAAELAALGSVSLAALSDAELDSHTRALGELRRDIARWADAVPRDGAEDGTAVHNHFAGMTEDGAADNQRTLQRLEREATEETEDRAQKAAEEERRRLAAEKLAAERRAEAERRRAARQAHQATAEAAHTTAPPPASPAPRTSAPQPAQPQPTQATPSPGGGPASGKYTGCRAYGGKYPPNAVDEKGRGYTRIDCTTKTPI